MGNSLLDDVHVEGTPWSAFRLMKALQVHIAMGGEYDVLHSYQFPR